MERDIALKEGKRRGWFSYTDLENLLDTVDLVALAQAVLTVSEHSFIMVLSIISVTLHISEISCKSVLP
jgi:hypothetical protein